ncbi:MAG TPA: hypothetical protein VE445_09140 [Nitrososphaeraceae archaeon]|nr:hypothetical protein [Nitrososphaeraceae archaeon]
MIPSTNPVVMLPLTGISGLLSMNEGLLSFENIVVALAATVFMMAFAEL